MSIVQLAFGSTAALAGLQLPDFGPPRDPLSGLVMMTATVLMTAGVLMGARA